MRQDGGNSLWELEDMLLRVGGKLQEAPVLRGWRIWVTEGILVYGAMCLNLGPELNVSMREMHSSYSSKQNECWANYEELSGVAGGAPIFQISSGGRPYCYPQPAEAQVVAKKQCIWI